MAKQVRYLKQVVSHLENSYGLEKAKAIMDKALKRYDEIVEENINEPKEYHIHTRERIYPAIAVFDAMISESISRQEAASFLTDYYKWRSSSLAPIIRKAFSIPGLYKLVPKIFMSLTNKSFGPQAGFKSVDQYSSKTEARFNMVKCPYFDKCKQYGCPEIAGGFCDADDICYGNMHPKISWDRTKTIGHGAEMCDFKIHIKQ